MLRASFILAFFCLTFTVYAQETISISQPFYNSITENFGVLKTNTNIKQGLYQAFYKRKKLVASGMYVNDKRTGIWHFYNPDGVLVQHYNYNTQKLLYEAPRDTSIIVQYDIPKGKDTSAVITRPIKVGGLFYGYMPFLKQFKLGQDYSPNFVYGVLQIVVSPFGRLVECKLTIHTRLRQTVIDTYTLNDEALSEDEKTFFPATVNSEGVTSTIYIYCKVMNNATVSIY